MTPIRLLASNLTRLQPQRLSATPAARALRSLARQARQAVRQYLPKRHPGTPAPTPARDNRFNGLDCLKDLQASHLRNIEANDWEPAYDDYYADEGSEATPDIPQPVSEPVAHTEAQFKALVDAHTAIAADMGQARVNALPGLRARGMVKKLQEAAVAIAAIPDRKAGAADADSAHLEALKGYAASLKAARSDAVVLRADLLVKGTSDKALDPLIEKLAAQQKAVSAYIRLLEA